MREVLEAMCVAGSAPTRRSVVPRRGVDGPGADCRSCWCLTQLSAGYVGHDTGPMHVAAAMNKPVLAVFGGGTWPRFRPAVAPSVALLVGVPCVGCGWVCAFEQPYCIKSVPAGEVLRAATGLEEGRVAGREWRRAGAGGVAAAADDPRGGGVRAAGRGQKAELSKQLCWAHRERESDVASLHEALAGDAAERAAESLQLRTQLQQVHDEAARAAEVFAAHADETDASAGSFKTARPSATTCDNAGGTDGRSDTCARKCAG